MDKNDIKLINEEWGHTEIERQVEELCDAFFDAGEVNNGVSVRCGKSIAHGKFIYDKSERLKAEFIQLIGMAARCSRNDIAELEEDNKRLREELKTIRNTIKVHY